MPKSSGNLSSTQQAHNCAEWNWLLLNNRLGDGLIRTTLWSDLPSEGRAVELQESLTFVYSRSKVLFSLVAHLTNWHQFDVQMHKIEASEG